jgi:type III secretory pathway component EscU
MRKWLYIALFAFCVVLGYSLRGVVGREAFTWVVVGFLSLILVLKLVQLVVMRYVKVQEARMSPEERREFEEFKSRNTVGGKPK